MAGNTTTRKAVIKPSMPRIVGWHTAAPQNHAEIIMYENLPFVYGCYTSPKVALVSFLRALKIVDHYSKKKKIHSRHRYLPHADAGITEK